MKIHSHIKEIVSVLFILSGILFGAIIFSILFGNNTKIGQTFITNGNDQFLTEDNYNLAAPPNPGSFNATVLNQIWIYFNSIHGVETDSVKTPLNQNTYNLTSTDFSWCAWFNNSGPMANSSGSGFLQSLITSYPGTSPQTTLYYDWPNNRTQFLTRNSTILNIINSPSNSANRSIWIHTCAVVNRSELAPGTERLFINGIAQTSGAIATDAIIGTASNTNITIGCNFNPGASTYFCFNGSIDEVRIYNRTLNSQEVLDIYNTGR